MTRVDEVRAQLQELVHANPFCPFIVELESGKQVLVDHPEAIAYRPDRQTFYILTDDGEVRSNLGAITSLHVVNRTGLAG
jgi:hypothetical protein